MIKWFSRSTRGQSTLEYAVLIVVIMAVFAVMQVYMKRGFQGKFKTTVDDFGDQYDPRYVNSLVRHTITSNSDTSITIVPTIDAFGREGIYTNRVDNTRSTENRQVNSVVGDITTGIPNLI